MTTYRIKFDHMLDGKYILFPQNKEEGKRWIENYLSRFPYVKAHLEIAKEPFGSGWKSHRTYMYRKNKKTGKMRLVRI
ncbi:MAG: hypothetical protein ABIB46_06265 [bacterium]